MNRRRVMGTLIGVAVIVTLVYAHEGHKAITTKGVMLGPVTSNLLMEPLARKAVGLATAKADFGTIEEAFGVPARVFLPWDRQGFASTRIAGIIESIKVRPGEFVKAGDVLAEVSSLELEALQLELVHRHLEKKLIEQNLARAKDLGERIIAGKEILELETDLRDKANEIKVAVQKLEAVGLRQEAIRALEEKGETTKTVPIVAPIGGAVVHVDVTIGASVEPTKHLVEIHDLSLVWVQGEVPESRIALAKEGMAARVSFPAYPDRKWTGKLERLGQAVSEQSRTVPVWASIENADGVLKPGLFGQMALVTGISENVTVAPLRAIVEDGAERYAIVQEKPNTYVRVNAKEKTEEYSPEKKEGYVFVDAYVKKNVVVGRSDGRLVEILEGLYPGDTVVAEASHELAALYVQGTLKLSDEARKNMRLATEEVDLRPIEDVVRLNAVLEAPVGKSAFASSRIEGKVLRIHAIPGQEVKPGATLAEVHSLEMENLQLDYFRAALRERLLRTLVEQLRSLGEVAPRKELLRMETEHRTQLTLALNLRQRLKVLAIEDAALDRLAESGETVRSLPVKAPIGGKVVDVDVVVGQVVKPEDHLFKLVDRQVLWAEAKVFEGDFKSVILGEPRKDVLLRVGGRDIPTRLSFMAQSMAYHEKVLPIYAEIKNEDESLLPGMIGEMLVVVGRPEKKGIAAPHRAIYTVGGQAYAFVAEGSSFKRVPLELGRRGAEYVEVTKGLFPGDKVAVSGVNELNTAINSLK